MKRIAVFCGSRLGADPAYAEAASSLGKLLADRGIELVYGGGKIGLMGVLADAVLAHGGKVIGVIPNLLKKVEVLHQGLDELYTTKKMSKRKVKISRLVDAYLILPGGFGTLDEFFEATTLGQLGIESKPVGILNTKSYYDLVLRQMDHMVQEGFLSKVHREMIQVDASPEHLLELLAHHQVPRVSKIQP